MKLDAVLAQQAPNIDYNQVPAEVSERGDAVIGFLGGLALYACVAGLIIVVIKMVISFRRGSFEEDLAGLGKVLAGAVTLGLASVLINFAV